jgi:hypothetical protein
MLTNEDFFCFQSLFAFLFHHLSYFGKSPLAAFFQEITSAVYWTDYLKQNVDCVGITILARFVIRDQGFHWIDRRRVDFS